MIKPMVSADVGAGARRNCYTDCRPVQRCSISPRSVVLFLSVKAVRGGPRLLIQITTLLLALMLVTRLLPEAISEVAFGRLLTKTWKWPLIQGSGDDLPGGGLRMVVFGSPDVAGRVALEGSDGRPVSSGRSWTEYLCSKEYLNCTSYLSFVPTTSLPAQSFTSKLLYGTAINHRITASFAAGETGNNFTFLAHQYPNATTLPDFGDQIERFLSVTPPKYPPKETIWVFSFGTWDVWSLAALPRDQAQGVLRAAAQNMFSQIEVLYQHSMDPESIAFSDFWLYENSTALEDFNANKTWTVGPRGRENFRILLPELFDVSLTPGWHSLRPTPPEPHNKAEQMATAAYLTGVWNSEVRAGMTEWLRTTDPEPAPIEEDEEDEDFEEEGNSLLAFLPYLQPKRPPKASMVLVPYPKRMAAQSDMPSFIRAAIVERQLRLAGSIDHNGLGAQPDNSSINFQEVWLPCVRDYVGRTLEARAGGGDILEEPAPGAIQTCDHPDDYLFFTPFTVAERAKKEIARDAFRTVARALAWGTESEADVMDWGRRGSERGFARVVR